MRTENESERRMAALCRRLGHLWPKRKKVILDDVVSEAKLIECQHTLLGRLYGNPSVNLQAFQSTMTKAWKSAHVVCKHLEPGLFSFEFPSAQEKDIILNSDPWSFSSHLLVLKPWEPSTPPYYL